MKKIKKSYVLRRLNLTGYIENSILVYFYLPSFLKQKFSNFLKERKFLIKPCYPQKGNFKYSKRTVNVVHFFTAGTGYFVLPRAHLDSFALIIEQWNKLAPRVFDMRFTWVVPYRNHDYYIFFKDKQLLSLISFSTPVSVEIIFCFL
jgi:hypothetical protein